MFRALLPLLLAACAHAGGPIFESTRVFALTPGNKPNYRIPSIIQAPNGDVLIVCERRNDGPGDVGNHDIVLKRSRDRGRTWSAEQVVFDDGDRVCTDLTVGLADGKLWLFFLRDKKRYACFTSSDSGATWDGPRDLHAFTDDGVLHLFLPHRWQQVLHLTIRESALLALKPGAP